MRLKKSQKERLLAWISEGLQSDEINERAAVEEPPFAVSRQQVGWYRDRRAVDIQIIQRAGEYDALTAGLAIKAERVRKLQQLAALMERDLFGGFLWTDQVKSIGTGDAQQEVEYEEFNTAEVQQYRAALDDIAKEMGHRRTGIDLDILDKEREAILDRLKNSLSDAEYARVLRAIAGTEGQPAA